MAVHILPSQEYLRECLDYDPATGILRWRKRPPEHFSSLRIWKSWTKKNAGKITGCPEDKWGRLVVRLDSVNYKVHRIIWKLMNGQEPPARLDHRNQEANDNKFDNLRQCSQRQNCQNRRVRCDNVSGLKGVHFVRASGRYYGNIQINGVRKHLGVFLTAEAAHAAYCEAARKAFSEFWSPG